LKVKVLYGIIIKKEVIIMEILQLKYFCDAVQTQNFSKTAKKFLVPPSNISQTIKRLEKELERLNAERREVESGSDEFEREIAALREKLKDKNSSRDTFYEAMVNNESQLTRLLEKQNKLGSQLWDDYELTYEDAVALNYAPVTEENREEIASIQTSCRAKLRSLGNYNPGAIEEFAEVKTRYDDLNTQYVDLTNSYDELINIIAKLEDEMRVSFVTAFEEINKNFAVTFKELFGGGNAELSLTDPEDVLTSGIEIKAAPP
jgi:chromosome segregation protein